MDLSMSLNYSLSHCNSTMKDLNDYVVLDLESGTYFSAANSTLINWSKLNADQLDIMINGSDTERCMLADEIGEAYSNN